MKTTVQLITMSLPKGGLVQVIPSRVYACLNDGWRLVDKVQQQYYVSQVERINASLVTHSH